jgi:hypothetical protein
MNYSIPLEIEIVSESRERSKRLFYLDAPIYAVFLSVIGRAKSLPPEMAAPLDELKSSIDHDSKPDLDVLAEVGKEFERLVDISRQRRAAKESRDRVAGSDH